MHHGFCVFTSLPSSHLQSNVSFKYYWHSNCESHSSGFSLSCYLALKRALLDLPCINHAIFSIVTAIVKYTHALFKILNLDIPFLLQTYQMAFTDFSIVWGIKIKQHRMNIQLCLISFTNFPSPVPTPCHYRYTSLLNFLGKVPCISAHCLSSWGRNSVYQVFQRPSASHWAMTSLILKAGDLFPGRSVLCSFPNSFAPLRSLTRSCSLSCWDLSADTLCLLSLHVCLK